ncbi:MAG: hypothetical protein QXZ09_06085 [Candidatus Methanomethylicaceae archaeon]
MLSQKIYERVTASIINERSRVWRPAGFRASEAGHLCARYQYHALQDWEKRPTPDPRLAAIFALGIELERYVEKLLSDAGMRLIKQQVALEDRDLGIVGHIDGFLIDEESREEVPVEIKSVNQFDWDAINTWADMANDGKPLLLRWALQLPLYMYLTNTEHGIYLLLNKQTGELKAVDVTLQEAYQLLEDYNAIVIEAKKAIKTGKPPEPKPKTAALCAWCWCRQVGLCEGIAPELPSGADLDAAAEAAAVIASLREAKKQYEEAQKRLSEALKGLDLEPGQKLEIVAGAYPIRVTAYETTQYQVPKDVKEQYAVKVIQRRVEVLG